MMRGLQTCGLAIEARTSDVPTAPILTLTGVVTITPAPHLEFADLAEDLMWAKEHHRLRHYMLRTLCRVDRYPDSCETRCTGKTSPNSDATSGAETDTHLPRRVGARIEART